MRSLACLLAALALALDAAGSFAAALPPTVMEIRADVVELDLSRQTTRAHGQTRLDYGNLELHADQVTANRATGEIEASGHLALVQQGRRLEGDSLKYDYRREEGSLTQARVREQGVVIRGESIEFSPTRVVAHHASFTTCDKQPPDYALGADLISLTALQPGPQGRPESGRLTLDRARVIYHGHRLFTLPRYTVSVGQIGQAGTSPFPASGFDRDDGPYGQISYSLGRAAAATTADLSYRLTSFRGVRGYLKLRRNAGPLELSTSYVRREASSDREVQADEFTTHLADVMVNREPEFRAAIPALPVGRSLRLRAEVLQGSYSETRLTKSEIRARADRTALSALLVSTPYRVFRDLTLSQAMGWRRSDYSSGDRFDIRLVRHSLDFAPSGPARLSLSYVSRRGDGRTPFLFDAIEVGRELLADVRLRLGPRWQVRLVDLYDLTRRDSRDIMLAVTRTVHCLDYTVGWRKSRGTLFFGIGLTPPSAPEREHERAGAATADYRIPALGED